MAEEKQPEFKQVMTPHKDFMAEFIPPFWEWIKKELDPAKMISFGGEIGVYVYKRTFANEEDGKILACRIEFIEFEEEKCEE